MPEFSEATLHIVAGLLLPIYVVSDIFGLWAYRHAFDRRVLAILVPGTTLGVGLGYLVYIGLETLRSRVLVQAGLAADEQIIAYLYLGTPERELRRAPEVIVEDFVSAWEG